MAFRIHTASHNESTTSPGVSVHGYKESTATTSPHKSTASPLRVQGNSKNIQYQVPAASLPRVHNDGENVLYQVPTTSLRSTDYGLPLKGVRRRWLIGVSLRILLVLRPISNTVASRRYFRRRVSTTIES